MIDIKNNPIWQQLGFPKIGKKKYGEYFYILLLKIHNKEENSSPSVAKKLNDLEKKPSLWFMIYRQSLLMKNKELNIPQIVYKILYNQANKLYTSLVVKFNKTNLVNYLPNYITFTIKEIEKRKVLNNLVRKMFNKKKRSSLFTNKQFTQNKFIFNKNLLKNLNVEAEINKQEKIYEKEETLKKMTTYFLKNYLLDKNFNSNMFYYQKKLGINEPIKFEFKEFPSTKWKNEELLFKRNIRNATSAIQLNKEGIRKSYEISNYNILSNIGGIKENIILNSKRTSVINISPKHKKARAKASSVFIPPLTNRLSSSLTPKRLNLLNASNLFSDEQKTLHNSSIYFIINETKKSEIVCSKDKTLQINKISQLANDYRSKLIEETDSINTKFSLNNPNDSRKILSSKQLSSSINLTKQKTKNKFLQNNKRIFELSTQYKKHLNNK